jgi:hypothetical protein
MYKIAKYIFGLNIISLKNLLTGHPFRFLNSTVAAYDAVLKTKPKEGLELIPVITLDEILGDRKPRVTLPVQKYEDGMLPSREAMVLAAILVAESPTEVVEIGTYMGQTTRLLAENCPEAKIHTIDLPLEYAPGGSDKSPIPKDDFHLIGRRQVGREFIGSSCANRITQHLADTALWNFDSVGKPTFFFIDGSHTYEYCKNDSEKCLALIAASGVFLWHDVDDYHPEVVKFINEWRSLGRDIRRIDGTSIGYWKCKNK